MNEGLVRADCAREGLQQACQAAVDLAGLAAAELLVAGAGGALRRVAGAGFAFDTASPAASAATSDRAGTLKVAEAAFRRGRPAVARKRLDVGRAPQWRDFIKRRRVAAAAAVPILDQGKVEGVVVFYLGRQHAISAAVLRMMERIGENIAFALRAVKGHEARRLAKHAALRQARMLTVLSATNEAIFRSETETQLLRDVCEALVRDRDCVLAAISLREGPSLDLRLAVCLGRDSELSDMFAVSMGTDRENGIGHIALRTAKPCVSRIASGPTPDLPIARALKAGVRAGAAVPLLRHGNVIGLIHLYVDASSEGISDDLLRFMSRVADNVAFGIETFERGENNTRLSRMFAALNATNEAILRATTREELFTLVCNAAVEGAKFCSTTVLLASAQDSHFRVAASAGPKARVIRRLAYSPRTDLPEGHGMSGCAFRSGEAVVMNDYANDERTRFFSSQLDLSDVRSGAALPLISKGEIIGVLAFTSYELNTFTPEFVLMLRRLADNVSFALDNFERSDAKQLADAQIRYLATHDALTNLPNRAAFNSRLESAIRRAQLDRSQLALLFIDLDRFKIVNDSLGHDAGDALLVEMARRLKGGLSDTDVVARLGGDEFVVIMPRIAGDEAAACVARRLLSLISKPLTIGEQECLTTASIGISIFPRDGADPNTLMRHADMAMYLAKEDGKNDFRFFNRQTKRVTVERLVLESQLRHALELKQFSLHYQPKLSVAGGQVTGVEGLLRWEHPDLGEVPPGRFIPIAEETGLIVAIGRWALRAACLQHVAWQRQGARPISIAVNLSPRQFRDEGLLDSIDEILAETGMAAELLQLEITESMVMVDVEQAIALLDAIQSRGIRLAIDDFGTGYSSMSIMKRFPIDTIKIDRSFIGDLPDDSENRAITEAIIQMGRALGLTTVAEGVETEAQREFLHSRGCEEMQGYLFSRPVSADQIPALINQTFDRKWTSSPPLQPAEEKPRFASRVV